MTGTISSTLRKAIPNRAKGIVRKWLSAPLVARLRLGFGVQPLSNRWGQRGNAIHRYYLEEFLQKHAASIRGHCLEFQEDSYTTRLGKDRVNAVDILNKESDYPGSTIVADLTAANAVPTDHFDCIICTYVLHYIRDLDRFVSEVHRILKPGGTLLICGPNITIHYKHYPELWRFTEYGLSGLLERHFAAGHVEVQEYGNSLTAAGEIRGLALTDFSAHELDYHDPRFSVIVCARAVKSTNLSSY